MKRKDLDRIRDSVLWTESQAKFSPGTYQAKPQNYYGTVGVTVSSIASGESGTITEQYYNRSTSSWTNTGVTPTVYNYFSTAVNASTKVVAVNVGACLVLIAADCPGSS